MAAASGWRRVAAQGARYVVTGGTAAVVDIGGFAVLLRLGLDMLPAAALSFGIASICNYLLTSRFVFDSPRSRSGYARFLLFALVGLVLNVVLTLVLVAAGAPPVVGKTIAIGISFVANFALNALFVFRRAD